VVQIITHFSLDPTRTRFIHHVPAEEHHFEVTLTFQPGPDGTQEATNPQWRLCTERIPPRAPHTGLPGDQPQSH
jgi:hypothetical protein